MRTTFARSAVLAVFALILSAGASAAGTGHGKSARAKPGPWHSLLENSSAKALRGWQSPDLPPGWHVSHGVISKHGEVDDLVTRAEYRDFELEFDWKLGKGGNSGVFYRGTREYDHIYWSAPEYQLLDDANAPDGRSRLTSAGAAYGLYPSPKGAVHAHDRWNAGRIVVRGAHVTHWLNGRKVADYELWSPDWKAKVAASKFSKYPNYGMAHQGYIAFQGDHPGTLALRNIRIRELPRGTALPLED